MTKHKSDTARSTTKDQAPSDQCQCADASDQPDDPGRRRSVLDRRTGLDRRRKELSVNQDRRASLERRRGPGIRRDEERRAAEEGEMTDEQFEFVMAVDTYKRINSRPFPTLTEILEIVKTIGYKKID